MGWTACLISVEEWACVYPDIIVSISFSIAIYYLTINAIKLLLVLIGPSACLVTLLPLLCRCRNKLWFKYYNLCYLCVYQMLVSLLLPSNIATTGLCVVMVVQV